MSTSNRTPRSTLVVVGVVLLAGCGAPMSILDPQGPGASPITTLWWVMFWSSLAILAFVTFLWVYPMWRPPERRWSISSRTFVIGGGVVWPLVTVLALLAYGVGSGHKMLPEMTDGVFRVEVVGHQWWWEVRYPDHPRGPLYDANEIHIPAGRPVDVHVTGADVIHSFWVPRLGGKIDAIPGQRNIIRIEAWRPGIYRGHCAEFCGGQHARMSLHVQAHGEDELTARLDRLADRSRSLAAELERPGAAAFERHCAQCHSIDASRRAEQPAPNLAGLADRHHIGAGTLRHDADNLRLWLRDHQAIKPGNRMPDHSPLWPEPLDSIARFLEHGE